MSDTEDKDEMDLADGGGKNQMTVRKKQAGLISLVFQVMHPNTRLTVWCFFFSKQGTNRPDLFVVLSMHFTSSLTLLSSSTVNFVVRECLHVEADLT